MIEAIANHLWQSTLFAAVATVLAILLRENRAQVRYCLWLAASLKFLLPFSLLAMAASYVGRRAIPAEHGSGLPFLVEKVGEPFAGGALPAILPRKVPSEHSVLPVLGAIWAAGFLWVAITWASRWIRIRRQFRSAVPVNLRASVKVLASPAFAEPAVFGVFRPVLLLPEGILDRLTSAQLEAVVAHELCHLRRRDNLAATLHMTVEALFWFYPRVWWIGARLIEERERACDQEVLVRGADPREYAEGILRICELYLESPLHCVAGITGSNLRSRIEEILGARTILSLSSAKKAMLATAAVAALAIPVVFGVLNAPAVEAQAVPPKSVPKWEVVSIKRCPENLRGVGNEVTPGRIALRCQTVTTLVNLAYVLYADGQLSLLGNRLVPVERRPDWMDFDRYTIEAKAEGAAPQGMMLGPMLQQLLEQRFQLKMRNDSRTIRVYNLTVGSRGAKLQPSKPGSCWAIDLIHGRGPASAGQVPLPPCKLGRYRNETYEILGVSMPEFAVNLARLLDREVVDKTGISGTFDIRVSLPGAARLFITAPPPTPGGTAAPPPPSPPPPADHGDALDTAKTFVQKLGLKLESGRGPGRFLVVEHIAKPSPD